METANLVEETQQADGERPSIHTMPPPFDPSPLGFGHPAKFRNIVSWNARDEGWPLLLQWRVEEWNGEWVGLWWMYHDVYGLNYNGPIPDLDFLQGIMNTWL